MVRGEVSSCVVKIDERGTQVNKSISAGDMMVAISDIDSKGETIVDRVEPFIIASTSVSEPTINSIKLQH